MNDTKLAVSEQTSDTLKQGDWNRVSLHTKRNATSQCRQCLEKMLYTQVHHKCTALVMLLLYKFHPDEGSFMPSFQLNCSYPSIYVVSLLGLHVPSGESGNGILVNPSSMEGSSSFSSPSDIILSLALQH